MTLTTTAQYFMFQRPKLVGYVGEYKFYVNPEDVDGPLVVITPFGDAYISSFLELPTFEEIEDESYYL